MESPLRSPKEFLREAQRVGSSRERDLLPTEKEKLDARDSDLLGLKTGSDTMGSVMLEDDDTTRLEKSSK